MAKLPFLGKGSFNEDRLGLFLLLLLLDSNFLSGRRKQNPVPKKSTYEKEREKKGNARKQLLKLSHGEVSMRERGSSLPWQCQARSTMGKLLKALLFVAFLVAGSQKYSYMNK